MTNNRSHQGSGDVGVGTGADNLLRTTSAMAIMTSVVVSVVSAVGGALLYAAWIQPRSTKEQKSSSSSDNIQGSKRVVGNKERDPETDPSVGHQLVWTNIGGALTSAMLYIGDRLKLYETLRDMCSSNTDPQQHGMYGVTANQLAEETGLNPRWLREWLAQQAACGILTLLPPTKGEKEEEEKDDGTTLRYRLPAATASVLADPSSKEYDIAMIKCVPSLVQRAKTMLPEAFATGIGRPYDEPEVAEGIDRHHQVHIRDVVIPKVIPKAGHALKLLKDGCDVADLGCGAGALILMLAKRYPQSTFHGYEVSTEALSIAATNLAKSKLSNVYFHDANEETESLGYQSDRFDVVLTFDVLHDAPDPSNLIAQVRRAIKKKKKTTTTTKNNESSSGVWILADIICKPTVRENIESNPTAAAAGFGFSTCLCMSCSLSQPNGAGLGTLGFTVPVAKRMLTEHGFDKVEVIVEEGTTRWFMVT